MGHDEDIAGNVEKKTVPIDLNRLVIPNPCTVGWNTMTGDERTRHCGVCKCNVYDLSEMTRTEAVALIENTGDRICGRLLRRRDGTVVTKDCPVSQNQSAVLPVTRSPVTRPIQFTIAKLLLFTMFAAGFCATVPIVGPKIVEVVHRWLAPSVTVTKPGMNDVVEEWEGEIWVDEEIGSFTEEEI